MFLLISTGCYHNVEPDTTNIIKRISKKSEVTGFEFNIPDANEFMNYSFSFSEIKSSLDKNVFNTLHAPVKNVRYSMDDLFSRSVLLKLRECYHFFKCRNVTFHIDTLESPLEVGRFVKSFDFLGSVNVENPNNKTKGSSVSLVEDFLKKYEDYNLTLDVCHALEKNELSDFLDSEIIMKRLSEVHWSFPGKGFNHDTYNEKYSNIISRLVKNLGSFSIVVIETDLKPELKNKHVIDGEIKGLIRHYEKNYFHK